MKDTNGRRRQWSSAEKLRIVLAGLQAHSRVGEGQLVAASSPLIKPDGRVYRIRLTRRLLPRACTRSQIRVVHNRRSPRACMWAVNDWPAGRR